MTFCLLSYIALNLYNYIMWRVCNNYAIMLAFSFNTREAYRVIFTRDNLEECKISAELFKDLPSKLLNLVEVLPFSIIRFLV